MYNTLRQHASSY